MCAPAAVIGRRSSSKLKSLKIDDRMLLQLPRMGLAEECQLEFLEKIMPEGGAKAIQALLNLMQSGVVDGVIWNRESWVGDSIGSVTGCDEDKLDLMDPIAMPPTGGCNLMYTEGVLENMINQLHSSVEKAMHANAASTENIEVLAVDVPRQVCLLVQRVRFTSEVQRCVRENRQISTVTRALKEITKRIGERLMPSGAEIPGGERATLIGLQILLYEQQQVLNQLLKTKSTDELQALWSEQMRFYHDDKEKIIELKFGDKVIPVGNEYSPPRMFITTEFTHTLRWAYLETMGEGGSRLLVLIGKSGCGKTGMLENLGQLLGKLPTVIRACEKSISSDAWWRRRLNAAWATSGGSLAPVILTHADRAPEAALAKGLQVAQEIGVAICICMAPGPEAEAYCSGLLAGATVIRVPESELKVIAGGQLSGEGLKDADALAGPLSSILMTLQSECSKQPHYDFGPRTLVQLCTQIGVDRKRGIEEKDTVAQVVERCVLPKLVKEDVPVLKRLLKEHFGVDKKLISASDDDNGRWYRVAENIRTITKIEPDCIALPVPPGAAEEAFFEEFCKMLNRHGSQMVKFPGTLSDHTEETLLGTMPRKAKDGTFEEVKDGALVALLRKAMDDNIDPNQLVWICMLTGNIDPLTWECLHELLNDSHCLNLATGEQLRLQHNLRFLFVMPDAGKTPQDLFSRAAIVYTDPSK